MPVMMIIITGAAAAFLVPLLFRRSIILLFAMRDSPLVDYSSLLRAECMCAREQRFQGRLMHACKVGAALPWYHVHHM